MPCDFRRRQMSLRGIVMSTSRNNEQPPIIPHRSRFPSNSASMAPLKLRLLEPLDDPAEDKTIAILQDYLQPDSKTSQDTAKQSLLDLLPENQPQSTKIWEFGMTCIELAEQIPYFHSSHAKLARLLDQMGKSPKFGDFRAGSYHRFQRLGEAMRDNLRGTSTKRR